MIVKRCKSCMLAVAVVVPQNARCKSGMLVVRCKVSAVAVQVVHVVAAPQQSGRAQHAFLQCVRHAFWTVPRD
ncbi:hypothetical protein HAX54_009189 [Datura stramonium]|uniref:Secreted protein n=1 Tax=Datura stramonium TaxID=4076 RepID=A0ABS8RI60_DATST|nr:hypothetical protein [Datura stramonium]